MASLETEEEHLLSICHDVMMMMLHSSGLLMSRLGNLGAKVCEILLSLPARSGVCGQENSIIRANLASQIPSLLMWERGDAPVWGQKRPAG